MYRQLVFLFVTLFVVSCTGFLNGQGVQWQTDLDAATEQAQDENKLILLHFSAEWCRPCKQLEKFVFNSARVSDVVHSQLIPVHIDTDNHPELVKQFAISEIPADVIINPAGRVITKRKSPKTSDDYIRMVSNLPTSRQANDQANVELTQKIDQVLSAAKPERVQPKNNDFVPATAKHATPEFSAEGSELLDNSKSRTQLAAHQIETAAQDDNSFVRANANQTAVNQQQSKRIINDTFFIEKSNRQNKQTETPAPNSTQFVAKSKPAKSGTLKPVATAKIDNPYHADDRGSFSSINTAKIVQAGSESSETNEMAATQIDAVLSAGANPINSEESLKSTAESEATESTRLAIDVVNNSVVEPEAKPAQVSSATITDRSAFALNGKCPVTLITDGKWMQGDEKFGCMHRGKIYLFANKAKLEMFQSGPETYSPVLAGYDPVKFHESGELIDGVTKHGVFMGTAPKHRIVLFSSQESRDKFQADPKKFLSTIRAAVQQTDRTYR